jgi:hypothetical protein
MFLLDTNVWLELMLNQERADEVSRFMLAVPFSEIAITEFSLHSIGLTLSRLKSDALFVKFVSDIIEDTQTTRIRLAPDGLKKIADAKSRFNLDFDDAYQYVAAEKHNLTLVSFDADFDRTERGRKTPADVLKEQQVTPENRGDE